MEREFLDQFVEALRHRGDEAKFSASSSSSASVDGLSKKKRTSGFQAATSKMVCRAC
jgi:hypothetical protein